MRPRTTLIAQVPGRAEALVVQPLSGQAAIVGEADARALAALGGGGALPPSLPEATLREARFVVDSDAEDDALVAAALADFEAEAARTAAQLVVVPTFGCNLSCTYCYQEPFHPQARGLVPPSTLSARVASLSHHQRPSPGSGSAEPRRRRRWSVR